MNYFAAELKEEWALMRQGRFTLDNLLKYVVQNQIEVIPAKYYNDDAQVKYLDFGSLYTYCCHGSKELLVKRWLRERIAYVDSMMGYFTSQDDQVTIRMNKTGYVEFSVTPYIPLYFSVKWSNADGGIQTFKLKRGETKTFYYTSTTATDQEVIIYHAQYIKELEGLSNLRPSSCILANATKLNNVEIHSDKLYNVNVSNNKYLRRLDLSGCSTLGTVTATGSVLDVSQCKYLSYLNIYDTALTGVLLNTSGGSLKEIYYPKSIQEVQLIKQTLLEVVGLPYGNNGAEIPTSLYTVNIQECPNIKTLNTSTNSEINKTWISMKYCQNLTIRNALDFETITLDGFQRLKVLKLENMFKLKALGFDDMLPVGESSTLQYMGVSYCPELIDITMNCTSNDYEITFADGALLNLSGATSLKSLSSNCVIHGLETIVLPLSVEHLFFTNEFGEGYSSIKNIWSSRCCEINTEGILPVAIRYEDQDFLGIDFQGMKMKDIDLGALVNIPRAINFDLSPTTVNPNFNINRDGVEYPYLQPEGVLNLSNYTESLARFFNGVDLDKLQIIVENPLPQTDLSYCFYNSTFSNDELLTPILSNLGEVNNLDYCFYKTSISGVGILNSINFKNCTMNYAFGECNNIKALNNLVIPNTVISSEGTFTKCPITSITNTQINTNGSCANIFKDCVELTNANGLTMPNTDNVASAFEGCLNLLSIPFTDITDKIKSIARLYYNCPNINNIDGMVFGAGIIDSTDWINKEQIISANDVIIRNNTMSFEGFTNLITCNNLLITSNIKTLANYYKDCAKLNSITFNPESVFSNVKSMAYMLSGCSSLINNPISIIPDAVINIDYLYNGTNITDISGLVVGNGVVSAINWYPPNLQIANDMVIKNNVIKFTGNKTLQYIKNLSRPNSTNWDNYFEGCIALKEDITFPSSTVSVVECYKDCIGITHIHSNWENEYDGEIVSTDCYAGCTGITHCDDVDLGINEYVSGLDEVPVVWGGYGFSKGTTGIYEFTIPNDNYTIDFKNSIYSELIEEGTINWGDGKSSSGTMDHTYSTAGTYIVKAKIGTNNDFSETVRNCITKCFQLPTSYTKYNRTFSRCVNLTYVSIKDVTMSGYATFSQTGNLTTLILDNITFVDSLVDWFRWSGITEIDLTKCKFINIVNMNTAFYFATKLTEIKFPSDFDASKINSLSYTFSSCEALTDLNIEGWDLGSVKNTSYMFANSPKITNLKMGYNINYNFSYSHINFLTLLTVDSLLSILNGLKDRTNESTLTFELGSKNLSKLNAEQVAIATNKNWSLV